MDESPEQRTVTTSTDSSAQPQSAITEPAREGTQPLADRTDGRDQAGKFASGVSGNPGGRPKKQPEGSLMKALDGIVDRGDLARTLWRLSQGKDTNGRHYKLPHLPVQLAAHS